MLFQFISLQALGVSHFKMLVWSSLLSAIFSNKIKTKIFLFFTKDCHLLKSFGRSFLEIKDAVSQYWMNQFTARFFFFSYQTLIGTISKSGQWLYFL